MAHEVLSTVDRASAVVPKATCHLVGACLVERMCAHLLKTCPAPSVEDLAKLSKGEEFRGDIFCSQNLSDVNQALLPYFVMKQLMHDEKRPIRSEAKSWERFNKVYGRAIINKL